MKMQIAKNNHQPSFSWKDQAIYDGDRQIAAFRADKYMGPILNQVVLRPGGIPLLDLAIGWRAQFVTSTSEIDRISASGQGSAGLHLNIVSHTPDKHYHSETFLTLTHDRSLNSYVYEVSTTLVMDKFPFTDWGDFCRKCIQWYLTVPEEFANIRPVDLATWQSWLYKNPEGGWTKIPLSHLWMPGFYNIQVNRQQGVLGMFDSPHGNPVIQLLGDTAANCRADLCFSAHDMHLHCHQNMYAREYWAKYRLCCYDAPHSEPIIQAAQPRVFTPRELKVYSLPRFTSGKTNDFTEGIDITGNDRGCFWIPYGDVSSSKWLKEGDWQDRGGIFTEGTEPVSVNWQVAGFFAPRVSPDEKYVFSAYIKTEELEGEGAYIFCRPNGVMLESGKFSSPKLTGTNEWTKIEIVLSSLPEGTDYVDLVLEHKGKGKSFFSAIEFRLLK